MSLKPDELKHKGFLQQRQKDQFIIRFRSIAGNMTSDQLRALADISDQYGKGYVHLTTRQGVEIPWIQSKDCEVLINEIGSFSLNTGASGARIRTIVACPGSEVCRQGIMNSREIASQLDKDFFGRAVPIKTKIAVSGCPNSCAKPQENDVGLVGIVAPVLNEQDCIGCGLCEKSCPTKAIQMDNGKPIVEEKLCIYDGKCINCCPVGAWQEARRGFKLYAGGKIGRKPKLGRILVEYLEPHEVVSVINKVIDAFTELAQKGERIADVIDRVGIETFKEVMNQTA